MYHPFGHLFDEVVNLNYDFKEVMGKLLEGMKEYAKLIGVNTLEYYNNETGKNVRYFSLFASRKF